MKHLWKISLILGLILSACGGLAGEPEIVATVPVSQMQQTTTEPEAITLPVSMPNIEMGAAVYQVNCIRCHGETARGDGEFVMSGQIPPLMDFNTGERQAEFSPVEWFEVITNGRLETLMPPWGGSLSSAERWSVAMYLYSLPYTPEQISEGEVLYQSTCAECHGANAAGTSDAPAIAGIYELSDTAAIAQVVNGTENMPAFGDQLSSEEITSLIAYVRTVGGGDAQQETVVESDTSLEPTIGTISGAVANGSIDGTVPENMIVQLHIVDRSFNEEIVETRLNSDGTFAFEELPIDAHHGFVATIFYQGSYFASEFIAGDFGVTEIDLPITLYEATNDPSVIRIEDITAQIFADAGELQVVEIITVTNTSDRVFIGEEAISSTSDRITLSFPLPETSNYLSMGDERYIVSDDGQVVMDTRAVIPGEPHTVHVSYTIPYDGSATLNQQMPYPLAGTMSVFIATNGLTLESEQIEALGLQMMGSTVMETYGSEEIGIPAGGLLSLVINGTPQTSSFTTTTTTTSQSSSSNKITDNPLAVGMIVVGMSLIAVSVFFLWRERSQQHIKVDNTALINELLKQIADLDVQHGAGEISDSVYQSKRAKLKKQVSQLMQANS